MSGAEPAWASLRLADQALVARLPHPRAYYELGRLLHKSSERVDQVAAIYALETAHALHPLAAAYTELGIVLQGVGRTNEAETALRKAIKFTPREAVAYLALGKMVSAQPGQSTKKEGIHLLRTALDLSPHLGTGYISLASALQGAGEPTAAQAAFAWAARLSPSDPRLRADWRHWHANWAARRESFSLDGSAGGRPKRSIGGADCAGIRNRPECSGIGYEDNLQFPWSGAALRDIASAHADGAYARLRNERAALPNASAGIVHAWHAPTRALHVAYIGSLSDEPQMRAMATFFRGASPATARLSVHPTTSHPSGDPAYLRFFLESIPDAALRPGPPEVRSGVALARQIRAEGAQILLDGLWRKECDPSAEALNGSMPCVLLLRAAPIVFSVLAAPLTSGSRLVDYTLGDPVCLPPRLAKAFEERFVVLQHGAYPFSHADWAGRPGGSAEGMRGLEVAATSPMPTRTDAGLPTHAIVLASFVQRWKLNPIAWQPWINALLRVPRSVLWLLQHPLENEAGDFALSRFLGQELGAVRGSRLVMMARQPLEQHVRRTGLADLVLDTWPYTAHTTVADAIWRDGAPWLAMGAAEDRMDSLLSSACLTSAGALSLITRSAREFEDMTVGLIQRFQ